MNHYRLGVPTLNPEAPIKDARLDEGDFVFFRNAPSAVHLDHSAMIAATVSNNLATMTRYFGLSAGQQSGIRRVETERQEAVAKSRDERMDWFRANRSSLTNRTVTASKLAEFSARTDALNKPFDDRCKFVLTPEQSARWVGLGLYKRMLPAYRICDLTPEQDAKIQALCILHGGQEPALTRGATNEYSIVRQEIETRILTERQRTEYHVSEVYGSLVLRSRLYNAALTPEQETAIRAKIKVMMPQFDAARSDPAAYDAFRTQFSNDIRDNVLTDEQRAKLRE